MRRAFATVLLATMLIFCVSPPASAGYYHDQILLQAVLVKDLAAVRKALEDGASPDAADLNGNSALHFAAFKDWLVGCEELLKAGAKVDVSTKDGTTPLHAAAVEGAADVARKLIQKGADPKKSRDGGWAAVHMARQGHEPAARVLYSRGGGLDEKNAAGETPRTLLEDNGKLATLLD